jgi:hypothetical protein
MCPAESSPAESNACALCGRTGLPLTKHHLIPKTRHNKRSARVRFDRDQMHRLVAMLCKPCHRTVHVHLTEKQLEQDYHDIELLRQHPEIARFAAWAAKQPVDRRIVVRRPTRR